MNSILPPDEIAELRKRHYNATVVDLRLVHDELMVLRVRPDFGIPEFHAGQYTTLGLGYWEPRAPDTQHEELAESQVRKVVKRAYSISFPILGETGELLDPAQSDFLEFYVVLVRETPAVPSAVRRPVVRRRENRGALHPRIGARRPGRDLFRHRHR
jgi:ferredoxin/flavodoxin---NADP+ reductase